MEFVSLYVAKTRLSALVDRASAGEEIVIAKNDITCARLVPIAQRGQHRTSANGIKIKDIASNFDASDSRIEQLFGA